MTYLQDFPSIYQVREKLVENDIITIFVVPESVILMTDEEEAIIYSVRVELIILTRQISTCKRTSGKLIEMKGDIGMPRHEKEGEQEDA